MEPITNTADLVCRVLKDDQEAFTKLVDRYRDAASAVAYTYFGSFDDVQDVVQEAFIHAYTHLDQLKEPGKFGPWLRRITTNTCLSRLRKKEQKEVSLEEAVEQVPSTVDSEKAATRIMVRKALGSLSENLRLTVTLSYINGYSHSEVAEFLEVPLETVRSRLKHAKRKLREEMITMVENVLHEDKPDEELVKQILDVTQRVHEAMIAGAHEEALKRCDDALAIVRDLSSSRSPEHLKKLILDLIETHGYFPDAGQRVKALEVIKTESIAEIRQRTEAEILVTRGDVLLESDNLAEAKASFQQAVERIQGLDDPDLRLFVTERIAHSYHNHRQYGLAKEYLPLVIESAREAGNIYKQAMNLWGLANMYLYDDGHIAEVIPMYEQAYDLFNRIGRPERAAMTSSILALINDVGGERFPSLIESSGFCLVLRKVNGVIEKTDIGGGWRSGLSREPWALAISVLWHLGALPKILDDTVPPGGSWSGDDQRYTPGAFKTTITVLSTGEHVDVPAGIFNNCLLIEMETTEGQLPDNISDDVKRHVRSHLLGKRRTWFAPGVGLVKFTAQNNDGDEADIRLTDYTITESSSEYFPLAIDNSWTYSWTNIPEEYIAKETYRVAANKEDLWYLEHYHYAYRK